MYVLEKLGKVSVMPSNTSIPAGELQTSARRQPKSLLYSIAAGIGGSGLDAVALESLRGAKSFLGRAVAVANNQTEIPSDRITTLDYHPVRLLSALARSHYMGAKKHTVDDMASRYLETGDFDLLHSWSGDCVRSLRTANRLKIPSVLEIPTWHRNKGKVKPNVTKSERERAAAGFPQNLFNKMLVSRQQVMEEYDRATLIFVLSEKARETFRIAGIPEEKLFTMHRGVDVTRFTPAETPSEKFRAIFVGSLIKRKGVHILLEAWRKAAIPNGRLILLGTLHPEIEPFIERYGGDDVRVSGFVRDVPSLLRQASVHVFPPSSRVAPRPPTKPPPAVSPRSPRGSPETSSSMGKTAGSFRPTTSTRSFTPSARRMLTTIASCATERPDASVWSSISPGIISASACSTPTI